MKGRALTGSLCLLLTAGIWGFAFVSQVTGMDAVSPLFFNALRFTLGAVSLVPVLLVMRRAGRAHGRPGAPAAGRARTLAVGALCGVLLFSAATLQQVGILWGRSAGRAGFITALYIVIVPLLGLFLHRRVGALTVVSVAVALTGFYLLCVTDGFGAIDRGDLTVLASSVLFAVHILVIDTLGARVDPVRLSFVQFAVTAALSWAGTLLEGSVDWSGAAAAWPAVVYAGVGSVGVAYTLQTVGQRFVPPTRAAMLLSLESFFSAVGGALLLGETMTPRGYAGCALIFAGTLLAQAPNRIPWPLRRRHGAPQA
ncbi:DMT family transporter [Bifidobacterium pullorum subsp. saeculare]|uniref:DMT family transporter n=1 Tax=Bifidobacterium pullorum subsp. saeculare TaxID=78257 RepID=A0A938WWG5_9BIFI|nr:DMT family transporter [Bifidobacterium pullorum]MBM6699504.1 DMT family transporter [Bifidobacterium pullorum subsp. saeculare]